MRIVSVQAGTQGGVKEPGLSRRAIGVYESKAYQEALCAFDDGADRDVRLFDGLD